MDGRAPTGLLPPGLEDAQLVAHGGFASVYRAWQPDFHREVAVKVLAADATDPAVLGRFEREVRAMGALSDHPSVVPVYDAGVAGDRPYLVMPFMAGGSLADGMAATAPEAVVRIGVAVADALEAAHRAGLLHRDVKPANILRTARGEPKLADFGVARFADATTTHGQLTMTLAYAAPELLRGEPATVASDVYSLGATMHALLRGEPPFAAPDDAAPMAIAMRIVSDDPPDLRAAGVAPALAAVVERAMAKDPAARYATAAALRDALDSLGSLDPPAGDATTVVAAPVGPVTEVVPVRAPAPAPTAPAAPAPERQAPAPRRSSSPWLPLLIGLAVVVAIVAVALSALGGDDDPEDAATPDPTTSAPVDTSPTTVPETTTTTTVATTVTTAAPSSSDGDAVAAARDYFALLDAGDIDAGWERLSPRYQNESGRSAYEGFWKTIESVEVLRAEPGSDPLTAVVELRYVRTDGTTTTETNTLRFVEREGGQLFVDGSS